MDVFVCRGCGSALTAPLSPVALPAHAHQSVGHVMLPPLMEPGTYAVDPAPSGAPWRWEGIGEAEAEAQGVFAPVGSVSFGARGRTVVAPGDTRGTVLIPEKCDGDCFGPDGRDGPNLACERCGLPVATRIDDCSLWQAVWLEPDAVRPEPAGEPAPPPLGWEGMTWHSYSTPPFAPEDTWHYRWQAAAGSALAHLLVASDGGPLTLPEGPVMDLFGRAVARLLPPGPAAKSVALAGPGPRAPGTAVPVPDIALVPRHPRTGEPWQPPSDATVAVPLAIEVWAHLALPRETSPRPMSGRLPDGVLRDDYPLPDHPWRLFEPDQKVFRHTLARLPAVRQPWLRALYDGRTTP
ncbi:hypothetical protein [Streptomyces sp. NPDC056169]|uniref:hypothetical protein n=1 Tax=Streptomyces sp. NPDC056169 TaxID=3345734 RepID=UPI0035E198E2